MLYVLHGRNTGRVGVWSRSWSCYWHLSTDYTFADHPQVSIFLLYLIFPSLLLLLTPTGVKRLAFIRRHH